MRRPIGQPRVRDSIKTRPNITRLTFFVGLFYWAIYMNEVFVLLFVAVFGNGDVQSMSTVHQTIDDCEQYESVLLKQNAEVFAEHNVVALYAECLIMIPRAVKYE